MTPTNTDALAARLESGWCPVESPKDMEQAAAELRRLSAERDALQADYSRLMEKHNNLHLSALKFKAERDALRAALSDAAQSLETIAKNAGKKLDSEGQENMLAHHDQVRGYANSRAGAAREAMKGTQAC